MGRQGRRLELLAVITIITTLIMGLSPWALPAAAASLNVTTYEETNPALVFSGAWQRLNHSYASSGAYQFSSAYGAKMTFTFTGENVVIYRHLTTDGGIAEVYLDGVYQGDLWFNSSLERWQVPAVLDTPGTAQHTLVVSVLLGKVNIDMITVPSAFTPSDAQKQAIDRVNWHRQMAGIPLVDSTRSLQMAAQSHADFVANNHSDPRLAGLGFHQEQTDLAGYIGDWPSDRASYYGYAIAAGEDGHFLGNPVASVDGWMSTVYHRELILNYSMSKAGYGIVNDSRGRYDVLNMGQILSTTPARRTIFTYPANGQQVPNSWTGSEVPDPLPNVSTPVGFPISLHIVQASYSGDAVARTKNMTESTPANLPGISTAAKLASGWAVSLAELRDSTGALVSVYVLDTNNDPANYIGPDTVYVIPQQPLTVGMSYSVRIAGQDSMGVAFDKSWSFLASSGYAATPTVTYAQPTLTNDGFGQSSGWTSQDTFTRFVADVNGDGKDDLVGCGYMGTYVALSNGAGYDTFTKWSDSFGASGGWSSQKTYPRFVADVNGDNRADMVGFGIAGVSVGLSTGTGFTSPELWLGMFGTSLSSGGWSSQDALPRCIADVNGDGKADVIGFGYLGTYVSLSDGSSFAAPTLWLDSFGLSASSGGWSNQDVYPRTLADMNGDGKADVVGFGSKGVYVALSNGSSFAASSSWSTMYGAAPSAGSWGSQNKYPRFLADADGDGMVDLIACGEMGTYISFSTGSSLKAPYLAVSAFGVNGAAGGWTSLNTYPRTVGDTNGDGKADIIGFNSVGTMASQAR